MKFTAPKDKMVKSISIAESIIPSRPQMQILKNILLETNGNKVNATSADLEVGIKNKFDANIENEGSITVNGSKFLGIIRELPDADIFFEVEENNNISIKSTNTSVKANFTLKGIQKEDFPAPHDVDIDKPHFSIPQKDIKEMIRKTIFSISLETSRHYLNGIFFETNGNNLKLVSTDGRRLAYIEKDFETKFDQEVRAIVPQKVLNELVRHLEDEGLVDIVFTQNKVFFSFNDINIVSSLIDGNFPDYNQVIPKNQEKFAKVNTQILAQCLNRSSLYVEDKFNHIKVDFSKNHIVISINNADIGTFREELSVEYDGDPIEIALNHKYLKEYLKDVQSSEILIEMNTPLSPVTIKNENDENYIYVVMPMKVSG